MPDQGSIRRHTACGIRLRYTVLHNTYRIRAVSDAPQNDSRALFCLRRKPKAFGGNRQVECGAIHQQWPNRLVPI